MHKNSAARIMIMLLLAFSMSFSAAFAEGGPAGEQPSQEQTAQAPAEQPDAGVIRIKGKYCYRDPLTKKLRKKAGFVRWNGELYYVQDGGAIQTGKEFRVGKHRYRAFKDGRIATGVYRWKKKLYYSDPKNGRWQTVGSYRLQRGVKWKGRWYFLQTNSEVAANRPVVIKDLPYYADSKGVCTRLEIRKTKNPVLKVARKQIGKRTKKDVQGFWTWFFGRSFVDTDATPWCGTFVGWCYRKAGQYDKIRASGNIAYVPSISRFADNRGKWVRKAKARDGDIIVFGNNRHVGIVERVYKGYIFTIEGNAGPDAEVGTRKPGAVARMVYKLDDRGIKGVIRP